MRFVFLTVLLVICSSSAQAQSSAKPSFAWPVKCTLNEDCWFMNYVDMEPKNLEFIDPFCNTRGYDTHKGTDIAIQSSAIMDGGVDVLAAKDGTVLRLRNDQPDRFPTQVDIEVSKMTQKECGNAILLDHGNGVQTMYCHLKKGSITLEPGDAVKEGDKLGEIGLSGVTEFPHLHFGITWEGAVMDPFTARSVGQGCVGNAASVELNPLWKDSVPYTRTSLYNAGFYNAAPELAEVDRGNHSLDHISPDQDAITFWFTGFGLERGDDVTITVTDPTGEVFSHFVTTQVDNRARQFYFTGRRLKDERLTPGIYKGTAVVKRAGVDAPEIFKIERTLTVEADAQQDAPETSTTSAP